MFRRLLVIPVLAVTLAGCGSGGGDSAGTTVSPAVHSTVSASPSACPTENTKTLAKTRFVVNAGLAFGAFHRWIYKPYKAGTFSSGADGRTAAFVKAGLAGAFALKQLNDARKLVSASPLLCKTLKQPVEALAASVSGLVTKLKSGDTGAIESVKQSVEDLRSKAAQAGTKISDKDVAIPGT